MILCTVCAQENDEGETFCVGCQGYLPVIGVDANAASEDEGSAEVAGAKKETPTEATSNDMAVGNDELADLELRSEPIGESQPIDDSQPVKESQPIAEPPPEEQQSTAPIDDPHSPNGQSDEPPPSVQTDLAVPTRSLSELFFQPDGMRARGSPSGGIEPDRVTTVDSTQVMAPTEPDPDPNPPSGPTPPSASVAAPAPTAPPAPAPAPPPPPASAQPITPPGAPASQSPSPSSARKVTPPPGPPPPTKDRSEAVPAKARQPLLSGQPPAVTAPIEPTRSSRRWPWQRSRSREAAAPPPAAVAQQSTAGLAGRMTTSPPPGTHSTPAPVAGQPTAPTTGPKTGPIRRVRTAARRGSRGLGFVMRWAALLFGLVTLITAGFLSRPFESIRDRLPFLSSEPSPVTIVSLNASSAAGGAVPGLAIDGSIDTVWIEGADGPGTGESLAVSFGQPVEIGWVGFTLGDRLLDDGVRPRLHQVRLTFDGGTVADFVLEDRQDFQTYSFTPRTTSNVTIEILSVREGRSNEDASLAEIEFFKP